MSTGHPRTILLIALGLAVGAGGRAHADPRPPDGDLGFPCNFLGDCPRRVSPGAPRRDVRPFSHDSADALGQPCAWRVRPTPEGPRRVRACW